MMDNFSIIDFSDRRTRLTLVLEVMLLLVLAMSYFAMDSSRAAAVDAANDFSACDRAGLAIQTLRQETVGPLVGSETKPIQEMNGRIEKAAAAAALPQQNIKLVSPQQPRRLLNSLFTEVPTQIQLADVTLGQITAFVGDLCPSGGGLRLSSIHLTAAQTAPAGKLALWTVDLTVAYSTMTPTKS